MHLTMQDFWNKDQKLYSVSMQQAVRVYMKQLNA